MSTKTVTANRVDRNTGGARWAGHRVGRVRRVWSLVFGGQRSRDCTLWNIMELDLISKVNNIHLPPPIEDSSTNKARGVPLGREEGVAPIYTNLTLSTDRPMMRASSSAFIDLYRSTHWFLLRDQYQTSLSVCLSSPGWRPVGARLDRHGFRHKQCNDVTSSRQPCVLASAARANGGNRIVYPYVSKRPFILGIIRDFRRIFL